MKVQAVVYLESTPANKKNDLNTLLFNKSDADVILFPGWSFQNKNHLENFQGKITNKRTLGFVELKYFNNSGPTNALFAIKNGELEFVSFQLFATSNDISNNQILGKVFIDQFSKKRSFIINKKHVRIMQCGELNILRNEQAKGNKVRFRLDDRPLKNEFEKTLNETTLILNPQHTPMGNQGKLSKRREYLSSNKRIYISTCNVATTLDLERKKSAHYAYFDGQELERNVIEKGKFHALFEYDIK